MKQVLLFYFIVLFILIGCNHRRQQSGISKDGYKYKLFYKGSPYTGLYVKYYSNGNYRYISHFIDSREIGGSIFYNENGTIQSYNEYAQKVKNGLFINYDENGKIKKITRYFNGKRSGPEILFYNNGKIKRISYSDWYSSRSSYIYTNYYHFKPNGSLDKNQSMFYKIKIIKTNEQNIARLIVFPLKENLSFKIEKTNNIHMVKLDSIYKFDTNGICDIEFKPLNGIDSCELNGLIKRIERVDSAKGYFERTILMNYKFKF